MGSDLTDLWVFRQAELLSDSVWRSVARWDSFAKNTVGQQLVRATDSIGANIAEAFGRFHYGEKLQFIYYARGSLYETRFWLRQAYKRGLFDKVDIDPISGLLTSLAVAINRFAASLKEQKSGNTLKESIDDYNIVNPISPNLSISTEFTEVIFTEEEISCLTNLIEENAS